jgi:phthalate 4,5-dioxygenase
MATNTTSDKPAVRPGQSQETPPMQPVKSEKMDFRVGPGTPLGRGLRRYWTPVCLSRELPEPDCAPLRVWLLGQSFVAFRDTSGQVGVLDEACPHRKASLVYGRNEEGGLRCLWHQWKFTVDGTVLETPNCPYKQRVRANAYPVEESGGLVWGYFGPAELKPPFPEFSWSKLSPESVMIVPVDLDCNFVRPLEGLVDSAHVSLLHVDAMKQLVNYVPNIKGANHAALTSDSMPKLELELTDFGFHYAAIRGLPDGEPGTAQVRITAYAAPYLCFIAPGNAAHISVPQDDTHTRFYNIFWSTIDRLDQGPAREVMLNLYGLSDDILDLHGVRTEPPPPGPLGKRNHFVQDRQAMKSGKSYSGGLGLTMEDAVMTCSIPGVSDHDGEHLVPADVAIVRLRRLLTGIANKVQLGEPPVGLRPRTRSTDIISTSAVLAAGLHWRSLVPNHVTLE